MSMLLIMKSVSLFVALLFTPMLVAKFIRGHEITVFTNLLSALSWALFITLQWLL